MCNMVVLILSMYMLEKFKHVFQTEKLRSFSELGLVSELGLDLGIN